MKKLILLLLPCLFNGGCECHVKVESKDKTNQKKWSVYQLDVEGNVVKEYKASSKPFTWNGVLEFRTENGKEVRLSPPLSFKEDEESKESK